MAQSLVDSYDESNGDRNTVINAVDGGVVAQSFTATDVSLKSVTFKLKRNLDPVGNIWAELYTHSGTFGTSSVGTGAALATSDQIVASSLSTSYTLVTFTFTGSNRINLVSGTKYLIAINAENCGDSTNSVVIHIDHSSPTHSGNYAFRDLGGTWAASSVDDIPFYLYGETLPAVNTDAATSVGSTKATLNGNIIGEGAADVTKRGFVYDVVSRSTPSNTAPAGSGYASYTEETGSFSTGAYSLSLTGLNSQKTYYVRAYAYNSNGYSYGSEITFSTSNLTRVTFNSADPTNIAKSLIDAYASRGGLINYDTGTTDLTGLSLSYTFNTNTVLEGINTCLSLAPSGWYWYVDVGTNIFYFKQISTTPDHKLILGRHIRDLKLVATIENVKNSLLFTGGDAGSGTNLFVQYTDDNSITEFGQRLERKTDTRVTLANTADAIGNSYIDQYKGESYETTVIVMDKDYDITLFNVGDTVAFRNAGTFVDGLMMQIVRKRYASSYAELTLGTLPVRLMPSVEQLRRDVTALQTIDNPDSASYN